MITPLLIPLLLTQDKHTLDNTFVAILSASHSEDYSFYTLLITKDVLSYPNNNIDCLHDGHEDYDNRNYSEEIPASLNLKYFHLTTERILVNDVDLDSSLSDVGDRSVNLLFNSTDQVIYHKTKYNLPVQVDTNFVLIKGDILPISFIPCSLSEELSNYLKQVNLINNTESVVEIVTSTNAQRINAIDAPIGSLSNQLITKDVDYSLDHSFRCSLDEYDYRILTLQVPLSNSIQIEVFNNDNTKLSSSKISNAPRLPRSTLQGSLTTNCLTISNWLYICCIYKYNQLAIEVISNILKNGKLLYRTQSLDFSEKTPKEIDMVENCLLLISILDTIHYLNLENQIDKDQFIAYGLTVVKATHRYISNPLSITEATVIYITQSLWLSYNPSFTLESDRVVLYNFLEKYFNYTELNSLNAVDLFWFLVWVKFDSHEDITSKVVGTNTLARRSLPYYYRHLLSAREFPYKSIFDIDNSSDNLYTELPSGVKIPFLNSPVFTSDAKRISNSLNIILKKSLDMLPVAPLWFSNVYKNTSIVNSLLKAGVHCIIRLLIAIEDLEKWSYPLASNSITLLNFLKVLKIPDSSNKVIIKDQLKSFFNEPDFFKAVKKLLKDKVLIELVEAAHLTMWFSSFNKLALRLVELLKPVGIKLDINLSVTDSITIARQGLVAFNYLPMYFYVRIKREVATILLHGIFQLLSLIVEQGIPVYLTPATSIFSLLIISLPTKPGTPVYPTTPLYTGTVRVNHSIVYRTL